MYKKVYCLFEQSGAFKNAFKRLGIDAVDCDIENRFGETDIQLDLFKEIRNAYSGQASIFDIITKDDLILAFFPCIRFSASCLCIMKIGLIDVDGHNYPNLPLMKLSAYHKALGDEVVWYNPLLTGHCDIVYMSKVFSFTPNYSYKINADKIIRGGSGYCIKVVNGKEIYDKSKDIELPYEIEHIYPDYSLYPEQTKDTAYGFLTRGCPRGCSFCHVEAKEGRRSYKVADLSEFWRGQKNIVLCDPNLIACSDWKNLLQQLIDSGSYVDINQGIDIRLITEEKVEYIKQLKVKNVHFAWDRYEDKDMILPKFKLFKAITNWGYQKLTVFVLTGFDTTFEHDLERVYTLRDLGYNPYVMVYEKYNLPSGHRLLKLQRWVNNRRIFRTVNTFDDYNKLAAKRGNSKQLF